MRDSEALELIAQAENDLKRIKALWKPARSNHHNRADRFGAGYPTGSGSAGIRGGTSDPIGESVERRAVVTGERGKRKVGFPRDLLGFELDEAQGTLRDLPKLTGQLVQFVLRFTEEPANGQAPEECKLCALAGYHEAVYAKGLCRWCYLLWLKLGKEDPHIDLVRRHCEQRRIPTSLVKHYHPHYDEGAVSA